MALISLIRWLSGQDPSTGIRTSYREDLTGTNGVAATGKATAKLVLLGLLIWLVVEIGFGISQMGGANTADLDEIKNLILSLYIGSVITVGSIGGCKAMQCYYSEVTSMRKTWWIAELTLSLFGAAWLALSLIKAGYWWIVPPTGYLFGYWWLKTLREGGTPLPAPERVPAVSVSGPTGAAEVDQADVKNHHSDGEELVAPEPEDITALLRELDSLIGLDQAKEEIRDLIAHLEVAKQRRSAGLSTEPIMLAYRFEGNPGTGKTSVARIFARILHALGYLDKGHLIESKRVNLIGEHQGASAIKTNERIDRARGGLFFLDEAYAIVLGPEDMFGHEAVDAMVPRMEDDREDIAFIFAGYPDEMEKFIKANPGLSSRISRTVHFPDYSRQELLEISLKYFSDNQYRLTPDGEERLLESLDELRAEADPKHWGNGRESRGLYEKITQAQSRRIDAEIGPGLAALLHAEKREILTRIELSDIERGIEMHRSKTSAAA